jgi:hypothetical protein
VLGASFAPSTANPSWALGDFEYNSFVDDTDATLLGAFYDPSAGLATAPSSFPSSAWESRRAGTKLRFTEAPDSVQPLIVTTDTRPAWKSDMEDPIELIARIIAEEQSSAARGLVRKKIMGALVERAALFAE